MNQKKDQKIVVFTTLSDADNKLINYGIKLAGMFKKELSLVYLVKKKESANSLSIKKKLKESLTRFKKEMPLPKCSLLLIKERLSELPEMLADEHEAILLIAQAPDYKFYSTAVTESPVPFLFIDPTAPVSAFKNIVLPIDLRKENSDTALWCSWFGRFGNSFITAVAANDKGGDSQRQVEKNALLAKRLFQKTNVLHKIFRGRRSSLYNSFEAMDYALQANADLLVLLGSSVITPLDWLIGLPERKIIRKAGHLPVLLVNPRRDNYILCD